VDEEEREEADTAVNSSDERQKKKGSRPQGNRHLTLSATPVEVMGPLKGDMVMQRGGKEYLNRITYRKLTERAW
jgi:hypothetical protein